MENMIKIGVISLGCAKNTVDTELILAKLQKFPVEFVSREQDADVVLINTCGFINDAKEESIETILEMARLKEQGVIGGIIVCGCLAQRYQKELEAELPEVDAFLGTAAFEHIEEALQCIVNRQKFANYDRETRPEDLNERVYTTPAHLAYLKIAEGCNNCCSYCVIPKIRGPIVSRPMEDIVAEAQMLADRGVKELVVIAQDTTKYGVDLYGKKSLAPLLEKLAQTSHIPWIRVMYCYPENIDDQLLGVMAKYDNILKYLDIPLQHFDDQVLKNMNRNNSLANIKEIVQKIRQYGSDFILRTTVIAGFPGETESQFQTMLHAIEELEFDHLGAFAYSQEEDTPAAKMENQIDEAVKRSRRDQVMELQSRISLKKNQKKIGAKLSVLIEGKDENGQYYGRSYMDAYQIDGLVFVNAKKSLKIGEFYDMMITKASEYDLMGDVTC